MITTFFNPKYKLLIIIMLLSRFAEGQTKQIYHQGWIDFNKNGVMDVFENPNERIENRVDDLLRQMSLNEKTCQLATLYGYTRVLKDSLPVPSWKNEIWKDGIANIDEQLNGIGKNAYKRSANLMYPYGNHAKAVNEIQRWFIENTRLGIPVDFTNEGIHGLNHVKATSMPAPIGVGSTWNKNLIYEEGRIVGMEAKALGYTNVYAPILDVARDQRWGRVLECYGEEPYLIGELGTQMCKGMQIEGIASTLKHFAVYSVPKGGRDGNARTDPHVAPRELHELYLYPFKKVIAEAKPMGVMCSYNDWDGIPIPANYYFLTTLLRQQYGFDGYVVSDSEAIEFVYSKHKVAANYKDAVRQVVEAGMNVRTNFTPPKAYILAVRELVQEGKLPLTTVDQRVKEVLTVKFRLGLFDHPLIADVDNANKIVNSPKNRDVALEIQRESLVLLKNADKLLPLDQSKLSNILVTGPLANETNYATSRYGPTQMKVSSVFEALKHFVGNRVTVNYEKGCDVVDKSWPESEIIETDLSPEEKESINKAVEKARKSDVIIAVMGEDELRTGESRSRTSLNLPGRQEILLRALYATKKPIVLVLINGQPLTINWADKNIPAILEAWFPGEQGGRAIAETLFGSYNPGGKLTVTFPKTVGQIEFNFPYKPASQASQPTSGPNGFGTTAIDGALYPFGYGLSYTQFAYSNLTVSPAVQRKNNDVQVSVDVANIGPMKGDEVLELYLEQKVSSVTTYARQLRGFERVPLLKGEKKTVRFTIHPEDLQILDKKNNWTVEPGKYKILIGTSSEDIKQSQEFEITP